MCEHAGDMQKPILYSKHDGFKTATLNILFSQVCFQNAEEDFRRIGAKALIREGTTTLLNKEKPVHHSTTLLNKRHFR